MAAKGNRAAIRGCVTGIKFTGLHGLADIHVKRGTRWGREGNASILEEIIGFGGGLVLSGQSRAFEIEADIASREWLVATGRDPRALVSFFEKLAEDCGVMCDGGGFLDSHPSFDMRIEQIRDGR